MTVAVLLAVTMAVVPLQTGKSHRSPGDPGHSGSKRRLPSRSSGPGQPDAPSRRVASGMGADASVRPSPSMAPGSMSVGAVGAPSKASGAGSVKGPLSGGSGKTAPGGDSEDEEAAKWKPVVGSRFVAGGEVHVGDPVEMRVTVVHDPKVSVNLPAVLKLGEGIEVLGQGQKSSETLDDGKVREEFWIKLVFFKVGDVVLRDVEVTYTYPGPDGGSMATVQTNPGTVKVVSVMANESNPQMKPDEGPVPVMEENRTAKYLLVALGALLLGVLAGWLGYVLYRRRNRVGPPPPPPRPAHEIAFEKLNAISESSLLDEGRFKEFYFGVSEAVREYLGNRFGFDSLEMTTTELLDRLKRVALVGISWEQVEEFSRDCDLVKFTKYLPDREEADKVLERAYEMVRASMSAESRPSPDEQQGDEAPALQQERERPENIDDESRWAPRNTDAPGDLSRVREPALGGSIQDEHGERPSLAGKTRSQGDASRTSKSGAGRGGAEGNDAGPGEEDRS